MNEMHDKLFFIKNAKAFKK